jgi:hypothetical protein
MALEYDSVLAGKLASVRGERALMALQGLLVRSEHVPIYYREEPQS